MKVARLSAVAEFSLDEVADPAAAATDAVIRVAACGVCGSDLHKYADPAGSAIGTVMGHEYAGVVVEPGDTASFAPGDRVVVMPLVSCGECTACRDGRSNLCEAATGASGAFAEYKVIPDPARRMTRIPDDLSFAAAALIEPLACAVHAVRKSRVRADRPVIVFGLGPVGQLVVQVLRADGVKRIVGVDVSPFRMHAALRSGATDIVDGALPDVGRALEDLLGARVNRYSSGTTAETVFECAGVEQVLGSALKVVAPGGTVTMIALYRRAPIVDATLLVTKDLTVSTCFAYTEADFAEARRLAFEGRVDLQSLVTQEYPLDDIATAFATQSDKDVSIKVVVAP